MTDVTEIASGLQFPEGPIAMPDGSVVLVEIARGTLSRVSPNGEITVIADCGGGPNGAALGPDGKVYVCNNGGSFQFHDLGGLMVPDVVAPDSYRGGSIERIDLDTGEVETIYTECDGHPLRAPNDIVFDHAGGFWFTDHGIRTERESDRTAVYYAAADGSSIAEAIFPLDSPNGISLSPDDDRLYVAETQTGRIWSWEVAGPGVLGPPAPFSFHGGALLHGAPDYQLFDSMAVDGEGWVCQATLINGGITQVSPDGAQVEFLALPDPMVTNICFGGDDYRTAYITCSGTGTLVSVPWPRAGLELAY
jgi:gluconolactonase